MLPHRRNVPSPKCPHRRNVRRRTVPIAEMSVAEMSIAELSHRRIALSPKYPSLNRRRRTVLDPHTPTPNLLSDNFTNPGHLLRPSTLDGYRFFHQHHAQLLEF